MSTINPVSTDLIPDFARSMDGSNDSSTLRRRIAGLTRMLDARDSTICDLVRLREQNPRSAIGLEHAERNFAVSATPSPKTIEFENLAGQLKAAMVRLQKAEKMVSIGQLAAGIAHDLSTPIQYVSDNVMFLKRAFDVILHALDTSRAIAEKYEPQNSGIDLTIEQTELEFFRADVPEAIEQSREGLSHIAAIATALKKFSRSSSDVVAPADLGEIIATTLSVSQHEWKSVADVETHFAKDLGLVPCIRDDIEKVVLNLIVNAAEAIRRANDDQHVGNGRITLTTRRCGDLAEILIADTGTGIPDALKHRVFEPFFTTKPVGIGMGQGLSIARVCVEHHHGEIFFESEPGGRTTFHVRIPLRASPGTT